MTVLVLFLMRIMNCATESWIDPLNESIITVSLNFTSNWQVFNQSPYQGMNNIWEMYKSRNILKKGHILTHAIENEDRFGVFVFHGYFIQFYSKKLSV